MNFDEAWGRVLLAGRELGSGPAVALPLLVPDYEQAKAKLLRVFANGVTSAIRGDAEELRTESEENWIMDNAGRVLLGVAIGLVMAEDPGAMRTLDEINRKWHTQH